MGKIDAFRKLIREEVRQVIREELKGLLAEIKKPVQPSTYRNSLKENVESRVTRPKPTPVTTSSDPIQNLLQETAFSMQPEEFQTMISARSGMAQGFPGMLQQPIMESSEPQVVESVSEMLAAAGPISDINQVEIDAVPDFSALMNTMKSKGQI